MQSILLLVAVLFSVALSAAEVASLQRGTAQSTGNGDVVVTLPQSVDPARSVLFFSSRHNSDRPPGSMLRGRLSGSTSVTFTRVSNQTSVIDINWTIVEFVTGVSVQRGTFNMTASTLDVALVQSVTSVSQAFVLWSKTPGASDTDYDQDDPIGGYLLNASTLRFLAVDQNSSHIVDYQVVEFTNPGDVFVQSGVNAMSSGDTQLDVSLPTAVNPLSTLLLAGYTSDSSGNQISRRMLNGELTGANAIRFSRERSGSGIDEVIWQVVEFREGSTVQQGLETFSAGELSRSVVLPTAVDPSSAVAFSGIQPVGGLNMGSTAYQSRDIPGTGAYTFNLDAGSVDIQRSNAASVSSVGWSVISFGSSAAPVLDLRMDELTWSGTPGEVTDSASGIDGTAVDGANTAGTSTALPGNPGTCRYGVFDGVDDHVLIPHDPSLNGSGALTYSAWIYPLSWSGIRQVMAKSVHGGGSGRAQMGIFSESNRLVLRAETLAGRRSVDVALPTLGAWTHVAGVFTGDGLRVYLNGTLAGSSSFSSTSLIQTTDPLAISKRVGTPQYFFSGFIDEVRVYTDALTLADVQAVAAEVHPCPAAPVGEWHFDEDGWNGSQDEVVDYSGNDYNGTAFNVITRTGLVCRAADMVADGTSDYIALDHNAIDGLNDFTIGIWYRGVQTGRMTVLSGTQSGEVDELVFVFNGTNSFQPYLLGTRNGTISSPGIRDGNWHFLAWTRSGADNCLYRDGVLLGCVTLPTGPLTIDPGGLVVGQRQTSVGGGFVASQDVEGDLDELLLFDSALTQPELAQILANNIAGLNWDGSDRICPVTGATGFVLNHDNEGINCLDEPVAVSAVDGASVLVPSYVNEITLQTATGSGNWSLLLGSGIFTDAVADDGRATYFFSGADNGSATFNLSYPDGDPLVDVDVFQSDDITVRDNEAEGLLRFAPSGFTLTQNQLPNPPPSPINDPLLTQTAGADFPMHISAYGVTDDDPQCGVIEAYAGNRDIKFSMSHVNPNTSPRVATVNDIAVVTNPAAATSQPIAFVAGQAEVSVAYKDVGEISLRAEDDVSFPTAMAGGTNNFVVKPASLAVTLVEGTAGEINYAPDLMTEERFVPAGEAFVVEVSSLDVDGDVTPSFGRESPAESIVVTSPGLIAPASGRHGSADDVNNGGSFSLGAAPGVLVNNSINFDETGIISLDPTLADDDYLGTGPVAGTNSGNIGRFYPARFEVDNDLASDACGAFSYMDQTEIELEYRVRAVNASGDVTLNYDEVTLSVPVASVEEVAENADDGVDLTSRLSAVSASWQDGEYLLDTSTFAFDRLGVPDGPYADLQLGLRVVDPLDPVPLQNANMNAASAGDCTIAGACDAVEVGGPLQLRYGRLLVLPSFGPETEVLNIGLEAQSYVGGVFRTNTDDSCSRYDTASVTLGPYSGNLSSGGTTLVSPAGTTTTVSGSADPSAPLSLSAPGIGNDGSVDVLLDVDDWLEFDWQGTGLEDPSGTASFGRYRGHDRIIFWREQR